MQRLRLDVVAEGLHPYECPCGLWHIGRSKKGFAYWWKRRGRYDPRMKLDPPDDAAEES